MEKIILRPDWAFNYAYIASLKDLSSYKHVVFDLSKCSIVDSEALKLIFKLKKEGKKVDIKNPPHVCEKIIKSLKIEDIFQECSSTHL